MKHIRTLPPTVRSTAFVTLTPRDHRSLANCTSIYSLCADSICPSHRPEMYAINASKHVAEEN